MTHTHRSGAGTGAGRSDQQMRYLSQAAQLDEARVPRITKATIAVASTATLVFLAWAALTEVREVARTTGEVVPEHYVQSVQHLEGGVVEAISVRDGDLVRAGEVMVRLNPRLMASDLETARVRQRTLAIEAERLRAFIDGRTPDFSSFTDASARMIADNHAFFDDMVNARAKEAAVINEQIGQHHAQLETLRGDLEIAKANLLLAEEVHERRSTLQDRGLSSVMQLLADKRAVNAGRGEVQRFNNQIAVTTRNIGEFEGRLASLSARHRDSANETLFEVLGQMDENAQAVRKLEERMARLDVRAPVDGLVKGLSVNTIGGVIAPGQTIAEVVPVDGPLEARVRISPGDIGHISPGQPVRVKVTTFDFSRYGAVAGELTRISATTFTPTDGQPYYEGLVTLDTSHVGQDARRRILPGMTVSADILTGDKTVLQYLVRPVHTALQSALSER